MGYALMEVSIVLGTGMISAMIVYEVTRRVGGRCVDDLQKGVKANGEHLSSLSDMLRRTPDMTEATGTDGKADG